MRIFLLDGLMKAPNETGEPTVEIALKLFETHLPD